MGKKITSIIMILALALSLTACNTAVFTQDEEQEFPVKIGHSTIEEPINKVVVLNDSIADMLIACGYGDKIVGRSTNCTQDELQSAAEVGVSNAPNVSGVVSTQADLVLADETITSTDFDAIASKGITVLRMANAGSKEELKIRYGKLCALFEGNITGKAKGEAKAEELFTQMEAIKGKLPQSKTATTACYLLDIYGNAITGGMFGNVLFDYAGAMNIGGGVQGGKLSFETIKAENPNFIFCAEGVKDEIMKDERYKVISAVKKNRVYEIPAVEMTRQGNTMSVAVKHITDQLYAPPTQGKVKSVAADYGITLFEGINYVLGEEDSYVLAIQKRLDDLGYMPIEPTGFYGDSTGKAVEEFQINNDISKRDGIADQETLKIMFSTAAIERETPARS